AEAAEVYRIASNNEVRHLLCLEAKTPARLDRCSGPRVATTPVSRGRRQRTTSKPHLGGPGHPGRLCASSRSHASRRVDGHIGGLTRTARDGHKYDRQCDPTVDRRLAHKPPGLGRVGAWCTTYGVMMALHFTKLLFAALRVSDAD